MLNTDIKQISIILFFLFIAGCSPKVIIPITAEEECPKPPPPVFTAAGIEMSLAKMGFDKISIEGGLIKSTPKVISTYTELAQNEHIWNWLLCKEDLRKNYTANQMAWFRRSRAFIVMTNPNAEDYLKWEKQNPFPLNSKSDKNKFSNKYNAIQLDGWRSMTNSDSNIVELIKVETDQVIKIESKKGRNEVFVISPPLSGPGTYIFKGKVKGVNLISQGTENYHRGKFQGVVFEGGREVDWPDSDFYNTGGWVDKSVEVNLDSNETVAFRVGLQRTQGIVFAKNIRIIKKE